MDVVGKQLREMILGMEIGPGERLTERWLESRLGTSRTPVRSALLRLEAEGLVAREGRGWMVTPINVQEVEQLFVYREVLEVAAVRLAAGVAAPSDLDALTPLLEPLGPAADREEAHRVGLEFHERLARLCGNEFIARSVADVMVRLARARWLESDPTHPGWTEHRPIVAALRVRKAEEAARLIEGHVRQSRDRVLTALREGRRSLRARGVVVA
jgi:DNA-binding GntR family transcriptional regulator